MAENWEELLGALCSGEHGPCIRHSFPSTVKVEPRILCTGHITTTTDKTTSTRCELLDALATKKRQSKLDQRRKKKEETKKSNY